jgi:3-dehydroquinate synthase
VIEVPDGEGAKNLSRHSMRLCEQLSDLQLSRHDVIVGVGGGAMTDLAGFAAAVYLRGVALVQVPTSLVGQVDAAIGGKTGGQFRTRARIWSARSISRSACCAIPTCSPRCPNAND